MKKTIQAFLLIALLFPASLIKAQTNTFPTTGAAGIGTLTPDASSLLDITSTSKGMLIPRMTKTQRDAIVTPVTGLLIYQTNNTPGFYYYSGTAWTAISAKGANTALSNLTAPVAVNTHLLPGSDAAVDLGSESYRWKNIYAVRAYVTKDALIINLLLGGEVVQLTIILQ